MSNVATPIHCGRPGCQAPESGVCVEGNEPYQSCPFFGQASTPVVDEGDESANSDLADFEQAAEPPRTQLSSGESLTIEEINVFLRSQNANFVAIIGESDSGKTTVIDAIYDRFLRGGFAGHLFAGSRTLIGLEKRSHYSRVESGRVLPDTARTSLLDGLRFIHFSLVTEEDLTERIDLMLSDRAGEAYRRARDNSTLVAELIEVRKANHVVLLLDGARVIDPEHRHQAMHSVQQTLRAFLDGGALSSTSNVQVVTTKIDLFDALDKKDSIMALLDAFRNRLRVEFSSCLAELTFWEIAARDPKATYAPAYQVVPLLSCWCSSTYCAAVPFPLHVDLESEFDLLLRRTPMAELL